MKISLTFDSLPEVDQFAQDWLGKRDKAPAPDVMTTPAVVPAQAITAELRTPAGPAQAITAELRTPAAPVPPVTAGPAVQTPMPAPAAPATAPAPAAPTPPAPAPQVTIEDVTRAAVALADQGRKADLLGLLGGFGVRAITELSAEQLGPFKQALDYLGGGA